MILTKEQKVIATMLGANEYLSAMGAFQVVENAITELTGKLAIDGITEKEKYNAFWVFTKNRVKFFKPLTWNENFVVSCFISSKSLAKIYFDVQANNQSGELAFYARVEACALDYSTQRIRKLNTVGVTDDTVAEPPTAEIEFCKFDYANLPVLEQVRVRSTNIDMSHHTNNLEYLRFILNTYSCQQQAAKPIKEIEVIYANQSFENDILTIKKLTTTNKDAILIEKDEKPVIKCEIVF